MSEKKYQSLNPRRRYVVLFSAIIILSIAWGALIFGLPPGMEIGAALLLVTPFAMCIIVAEISDMAARYVAKRYEH